MEGTSLTEKRLSQGDVSYFVPHLTAAGFRHTAPGMTRRSNRGVADGPTIDGRQWTRVLVVWRVGMLLLPWPRNRISRATVVRVAKSHNKAEFETAFPIQAKRLWFPPGGRTWSPQPDCGCLDKQRPNLFVRQVEIPKSPRTQPKKRRLKQPEGLVDRSIAKERNSLSRRNPEKLLL